MKTLIVLLLFAISSLCSGCATITMMEALPGKFVDKTTESIYNVEQLQSNNNCYQYVNEKCVSYYLPLDTNKQDDHGRYLRLEVPRNKDRLGAFIKEHSRSINIENFEIVGDDKLEKPSKFKLIVHFTSDYPLDKLNRTLCLDIDKSISKASYCRIESSPNANNAYFYSFREIKIEYANEKEIISAMDKLDVYDSIEVKYKYISIENTNYNGVFVCFLLPVTLVIDVLFFPVSAFFVWAKVMGR